MSTNHTCYQPMGDYNTRRRFMDLRAVQRDLLIVLAREGPQYGLEIKRTLDDHWSTEISHGRLYSNLDALADHGLIEKRPLTERANHYEVTERGERMLRAHYTWVAEKLEAIDA